MGAICEQNGGPWPGSNLKHWERVARRLGLKVTWLDPLLCGEAHIRFDFAMQRGRLYMPLISDRAETIRMYIHELSELVLSLDWFAAEFYYPVEEWGTHHDLALAVEELHCGPRLPGVPPRERK